MTLAMTLHHNDYDTKQATLSPANKPLTLEQLKALQVVQLNAEWLVFLSLPCNKKGEIMKTFHIWPSSTKRIKILAWFEDQLLSVINRASSFSFKEKGMITNRFCACGKVIQAGEPCYIHSSSGNVHCVECGGLYDNRMSDGLAASKMLVQVFEQLLLARR
ncbi:hypothetical protein [Paenibacillus sp. MMO-177]|uniref:hypothetical protein n=1 Tax=Paenibacillus sp. MMO-177 TaxID=3081289 RepID=UPI003015F2D1